MKIAFSFGVILLHYSYMELEHCVIASEVGVPCELHYSYMELELKAGQPQTRPSHLITLFLYGIGAKSSDAFVTLLIIITLFLYGIGACYRSLVSRSLLELHYSYMELEHTVRHISRIVPELHYSYMELELYFRLF